MGSSPRVRGRRRRQHHPGGLLGLIPAGAGQTPAQPSHGSASWAHPRGCGADECLEAWHHERRGSSPRVRGRRISVIHARSLCRLIPAGAGQTPARATTGPACRAHPRGCGADTSMVIEAIKGFGSSPRVRGRRRRPITNLQRKGLIPAGAGQTLNAPGKNLPTKAHPRGCGADYPDPLAFILDYGSSPRVRGRRLNIVRVHERPRLIPAGAGQTVEVDPGPLRVTGSSPRVRGRHDSCASGRGQGGLIPAGAGQTSIRKLSTVWSGAHPRGCWADRWSWTRRVRYRGSSPRVRGRHGSRHQRGVGCGLIPAGAGQTSGIGWLLR